MGDEDAPMDTSATDNLSTFDLEEQRKRKLMNHNSPTNPTKFGNYKKPYLDQSPSLNQRNNQKNDASQKFNTQKLPIIESYTPDIPPPYKIIIVPKKDNTEEGATSQKNTTRLEPIDVARTIIPLLPNKSIDEIKKSGRNRVTITTHNRIVANKIMTMDKIHEKGLTTYIPTSFIYKKCIIKGIPTDMSEEEIKENIELVCPVSNLTIYNIRRFQRFDKEKSTYLPTTTIMITYQGQVAPQYAFLYRVRYQVDTYIPKVKLCTQCFRYGHLQSFCRSKPRCSYCGAEEHHSNQCPDSQKPIKCINCYENHNPTDAKCRKRAIEQALITMATRRNISIQEAKQNHNELTNNKKRIRFSEFPELNNGITTEDIINTDQIYNTPRRRLFAETVTNPRPNNVITNQMTQSPSKLINTQSNESRNLNIEHQNLLISPNGRYNLNFTPSIKNRYNNMPNTPSDRSSFSPTLTISDKGLFLLDKKIALSQKDILDYLNNDPYFHDSILNMINIIQEETSTNNQN